MQSSSTTVTTFKLDDAELFTLATTSDYAGAPVTIQVSFIETKSSNGLPPSVITVSGYKVNKNGRVGQTWTERKFLKAAKNWDADDAAVLATFPAAILDSIGL